MKALVNKQLRGEKNPDKNVIITVEVSEGFNVKESVKKNMKKELHSLAVYIINNMREGEEDGTDRHT